MKYLSSLLARACAVLLFAFGAAAQSTVTLTPSITSGDGSFTIPTMSWSTNPALTSGTPCTASATPAIAAWSGAKAGSGTVTNLGPFSANTRLSLVCTFPGDSIVTFTWVNPTQNTDGSNYTNALNTILRYTFNPTLSTGATPATGETEVTSAGPSAVTRTVTGITQTGTLRAQAYAQNTNMVRSAPSNAVTKAFTGNFQVTGSVDITVRAVPNAPTSLMAE